MMRLLLQLAADYPSISQAILTDLSSYCSVIGAVLLAVMIIKRRLSYRDDNLSFPGEVEPDEVEALG